MWRNSWTTWTPLILLPSLVLAAVPAAWPRWALMWLLAVAIYAGFKWLTWSATPAPAAAWTRHLGYLLAWPGMDAPAFLGQRQSARPPLGEWLFAAAKLLAGAVLLFGLARLVPHAHAYLTGWPYLTGWVGMIGLILVLHFGSFHLLSCGWRSSGVTARPLMDWPLCSTSLAEFWGRRWNTAFRDLTHRFLFRPLSSRIGPRRAVFAGFALSGLVHDAVISLPAGGGPNGGRSGRRQGARGVKHGAESTEALRER